MPAFDVTTNPTKLTPLKPGDKATVVVTATSRLARPVTARATSVVVPDSFQKLVKAPPNAQRTFNQAGATQEFPFTIEVPADAKAGSCTVRFDVVDIDHQDDNFGQSSMLKVDIEVPPSAPTPPKPKWPWWIWVILGVAVVGVGIGLWFLLKPKHNMPNVVQMSFDAAKNELDKDSIRIVRVDTLDADTTAWKGNVVIRQRPAAGSRLNKDTNSVTLVVQKLYTVVPPLKGQRTDTASFRLGRAGLNFTGVARCNNDLSFNGRVYSVVPAEGTLQAQNSMVTFYVGEHQPTPCPLIRHDRILILEHAVVPATAVPRVRPDS